MQRHDTLLMACGSRESRKHLRSVLELKYNLLEASNTRQMLLLMEQNLGCIAAVVLDITNWDAIDQSIYTDGAARSLLQQCPVIVISDEENYHELTKYFRYGAADVIPLHYDPYAMVRRIETITQLYTHKKNLEQKVAEQTENLQHFSDNMVDALSSIIEYRDMESGLHTLRIRNFTALLLEEVMKNCPEYDLTDRLLPMIASAASLHDVGKIGIPDAILSKPGKLTQEEWEIMKTHAELGSKLLDKLSATVDQDFLRYAYNICLYHHERWDGRGYPKGLVGDEIPICAQVVGLADCYDALTSDRVYKPAYSHAKAANMILGGECGAFSPKLLECFKKVAQRFAELAGEYKDGRDPEVRIAELSLPKADAAQQGVSLLEKTQAKYYSIVHYLNAFVVEIRLDTGVFQIVYNPFPELGDLQGLHSARELADFVAQRVLIPEERDRIYEVMEQDIPAFIRDNLRRKSFYFHYRGETGETEGAFEMTVVRIGGANLGASLTVICRKLDSRQQGLQVVDDMAKMAYGCHYICRNDSGFTLLRRGRHIFRLGGYSPEEITEQFGGQLLAMAYPEDRKAIREEFDRQLKLGSLVHTRYRFPRKDGATGWVENSSQLFVAADGQEYLRTNLTDITDIQQEKQLLSASVNRYRNILTRTGNVLFELDMKSGNLELSDTWQSVFGYPASRESFSVQMAGQTHVHPDDIAPLQERIRQLKKGDSLEVIEIRIANAQGRYLWCRVRGSGRWDDRGQLTAVLGSIQVIESEKEAFRELENKANRDSLTGLLNKAAARQRIEEYLDRNQGTAKCALLVLDLDNFKEVNDRYGHLFGDALLKQIAQILTKNFLAEDIVARVGGDEFMVAMKGIDDPDLVSIHCRRIRDAMVHAFRQEGMDLHVSCSIGVARCPQDAREYLDLFAKADIALYQAKASGKNAFCFFEEGSKMGYVPDSHFTTPIDSDMLGSSTHKIFRMLLQTRDFSEAVNSAMAAIGEKLGVSRVYVFENEEDDSYCSNTFEWCNAGISPQIQNLQHLNYNYDIPGYLDNYHDSGVFYCNDIRELNQSTFEIVDSQGIKSMLHCAIRFDGEFKGYIGFDQCDRYRLWTKEEIQLLSEFSDILTAFLLYSRQQQKLQASLQLRQAWFCEVEPETYILHALDGTPTRDARPCYAVLMHREKPCEGCPLTTRQNWAVLADPSGSGTLLLQTESLPGKEPHKKITARRLPDKQ